MIITTISLIKDASVSTCKKFDALVTWATASAAVRLCPKGLYKCRTQSSNRFRKCQTMCNIYYVLGISTFGVHTECHASPL